MSVSRAQLLLQAWARAAGINDRAVTSEIDLVGFFQRFRPSGEGVQSVFLAIPEGDELLARLLSCYRASEDSYRPKDAFFVIRRDRPPEQSVVGLVRQHFRAMAELLPTENDLGALLLGASPTLVAERPPEYRLSPGDDAPEVWLFDAVFDHMNSLRPRTSEGLLLKEAYYSIANDLFLQYYLMWPLYQEASSCPDPFQYYFELWREGIQIGFREDGVCHLWFTLRSE